MCECVFVSVSDLNFISTSSRMKSNNDRQEDEGRGLKWSWKIKGVKGAEGKNDRVIVFDPAIKFEWRFVLQFDFLENIFHSPENRILNFREEKKVKDGKKHPV